jgi:exopolysaccharide biosynthesis polyprenyl glycosylphosphotransferase
MSRARFVILSVVIDAVLVNVGFTLAFLLRFAGHLPAFNFDAYLLIAPILTVLYVGGAWIYGLYNPENADTTWSVVRGVLAAVTVGTLLAAAVAFFGSTRTASFARTVVLISWALDLILLIGWRLAFLRLAHVRWPEQRVLIVGTDALSEDLARAVAERARWGWKVTGLVEAGNGRPEAQEPPGGRRSDGDGFAILGRVEDLGSIIAEQGANRVIISSPIALREALESIVVAEGARVRVDVVPELYDIFLGRVDAIVGDVPLMEISHTSVPRYYTAAKRLMDLSLAAIGLVVTCPLLLCAAGMVALGDGLPVFFSQERVGRNMKLFRMHKLRTMMKNAEEMTGPVIAEEHDPRITAVGRWLRGSRFDEIPQLVNILKGEMSFVGPRPERPFFVEKYVAQLPGYAERFAIRPGITGLAQVSGGYATTPERKLKYDLIYRYHQSFLMDVRITLQTLRVLLTGRGAR